MKYPINTASGDAGEFFFAYKIASVLQWPCRLFDIDIGIDAQVEVINEDRSSAGRFVAFQIKSSSVNKKNRWYVSEAQINYWRELDLPVFIVLVDLSLSEMFLHRVDVNKDYAITGKGSICIEFDRQKDRFSAASASVFAEAADEAALSRVRKRLEIIRERTKEIRDTIDRQEHSPDGTVLIELMNQRYIFKEELAQACAVKDDLRVGKSEYTKTKIDFENALQELRDFMKDWDMDTTWDDHGDITRFIEEGR